MKKYIIPALRVADIENEVILAGSGFEEASDTQGYTPIQGGFANRRDNLFDWDDNNEE